MRKINTEVIEKKIYEMALHAGVNLTPACKTAMNNALKTEKNGAAAFALETLLKNAETAVNKQMPVCQDTGMAVVLLEIGQEVFLEGKPLAKAVNDGIENRSATR